MQNDETEIATIEADTENKEEEEEEVDEQPQLKEADQHRLDSGMQIFYSIP